MKSYAYFAHAEKTGLIKIGKAVNVQSRLKSLQHGSPDKLTLLGVIPESNMSEEELHKEFSKYRSHGEWFQSSQEILDFIADCTTPLPDYQKEGFVLRAGTPLRTPGSIGDLIKGYRIRQRMTQQDLAETVGTSRQWIVDVEKGKSRSEIGLVLRVINALNIPLGVTEERS
jgi:y4mF family transcriptional regulator